jgi:Uma2 family endonuclease
MLTDIQSRWATSTDSTLIYRLRVEEYDRLAAAGALVNLQVELIDGFLVRKTIPGPPHARAVDTAYEHIDHLLPPGWKMQAETAVRLPCFDVLEPDLSIVRGRRANFRGRHPGPGDFALLVEVADDSLEIDRGEKMAAYAIAEIPIYWIINLIDRQVEVYSVPLQGRYQSSRVFKPGQTIPLAIDGEQAGRIAVADLLPR